MKTLNPTVLRIGNLLQDREGIFCRVEELNKDNFRAPAIRGPLTSLPNSPIPLTEEILLKCGFKKNTNYTPCGKAIFYKNGYIIYCGVTIEIEIKYLHQLQNLYYCLTGEELKVKI